MTHRVGNGGVARVARRPRLPRLVSLQRMCDGCAIAAMFSLWMTKGLGPGTPADMGKRANCLATAGIA